MDCRPAATAAAPVCPPRRLLAAALAASVALAGCWITPDSDTSASSSCGSTSASFAATGTDESAVTADGTSQTLANAAITSTSTCSSSDSASFYGINAAVLATNGGAVILTCSSVTTTGAGANGVFAYGSGSSATLSEVTIGCSGQYAHGVDAAGGGALVLSAVDIATTGANSAAIATDRGGGTVSVTGGTMTTTGADSPGVYSTGEVTISGASITASGAEGAVVEGANSLALASTSLSAAKKWGVLIYDSTSGDASAGTGTFTMSGGSLSAAVGPLFHVTNTSATIELTGVTATATSGILLQAAAGSWGTAGSNGGAVTLTAKGQTLSGSVVVDGYSSATLKLQDGSTLAGAVDGAGTAKAVVLTLDATSTWNVTADSVVTLLTDESATFANIASNGHTVCYRSSANGSTGTTYALSGGGYLTPCSG